MMINITRCYEAGKKVLLFVWIWSNKMKCLLLKNWLQKKYKYYYFLLLMIIKEYYILPIPIIKLVKFKLVSYGQTKLQKLALKGLTK